MSQVNNPPVNQPQYDQYEAPYWEIEKERQDAALAKLSGKGTKVAQLLTTGTSAKEATPEAAPQSGWKTAFKIIGHIFTLGIFKLGSLITDAISDSIDNSQRKSIAKDVCNLREGLKTLENHPENSYTFRMGGEDVELSLKDGKVSAKIDGQIINSKFSIRELREKIEDDIVTDVSLYGKREATNVIKEYGFKEIHLSDKGEPLDHEDNPQNIRRRELCLKAIKANLGVDAGELHSCTPAYLTHIAGNAINGSYESATYLIDHVLQITTTNRIAADDVQDIMDLREKNINDVRTKVNVSVLKPQVTGTANQRQVQNFLADIIYSGDIVSEDKDFTQDVKKLKDEARDAEKNDTGSVNSALPEFAKIRREDAKELQQAERLRNVLQSNAKVIGDILKIEANRNAIELELKAIALEKKASRLEQIAIKAEETAKDNSATEEQKLEAKLARAEADAAKLKAEPARAEANAAQIEAACLRGDAQEDQIEFLDLERKAYEAEAKFAQAKIDYSKQYDLVSKRPGAADGDVEGKKAEKEEANKLGELLTAKNKAELEAAVARLEVRKARADALAAKYDKDPVKQKEYQNISKKISEDLARVKSFANVDVDDITKDTGQDLDVKLADIVEKPLTSFDQLPEDGRDSLLAGLQPATFREMITDMLDTFKDGLLEYNSAATTLNILIGIGKVENENLLAKAKLINKKVQEATATIQEEMISAILIMDNKLNAQKYAAVRELKRILDSKKRAPTKENIEDVLKSKDLPKNFLTKMNNLASGLQDINDKGMRERLLHSLLTKTLENFAEVEDDAITTLHKYEKTVRETKAFRNDYNTANLDHKKSLHTVTKASDAVNAAKGDIEKITGHPYTDKDKLTTEEANQKLTAAEEAMNKASGTDDKAALTEATNNYNQAKTYLDSIVKLNEAEQKLISAQEEQMKLLTRMDECKKKLDQSEADEKIWKGYTLEAKQNAYLALGLTPPKEDDAAKNVPDINPELNINALDEPEHILDLNAIEEPKENLAAASPEQHLQELQDSNLDKLMASSGMDFSSDGYGKFLKTAIMNYFQGISLDDKRSMISSGLRYAPPRANPTQLLGAMLKGAGPILQKTFQGLDGPGMPMDLRLACKDMKSNLAPIPPDVVEAQLYDMVQSSHGRIKNIKVVSSLGAATVGQAFKCELTDQYNQTRDIVVKILRPDVANRAQRERKIFENAAQKVPGMSGTFQGQMRQIMQELDFKIETDNAKLGHVYDKPFKDVQSVQLVEDIPPKSNYMAMELAAGTTLDDYFNTTRKDMAELGKPLGRTLGYDKDGPKVEYSATRANIDGLQELRSTLLKKYKEAQARHQQLVHLSENWVKSGILSPNGFFHGDLHAGNIMSDGKNLTVIDFGNSTQLTVDQQSAIMTMAICSGTKQTTKFLKAFRTLLSPEAQKLYDQKENEIITNCRAIMQKGTQGEASKRIMCILSEIQRFGIEIPQEIMNFAFSEMRLQNTMLEMIHLMDEIRAGIRGIDNALNSIYDTNKSHDVPVALSYQYVSSLLVTGETISKADALNYVRNIKAALVNNQPLNDNYPQNARDSISDGLKQILTQTHELKDMEVNTVSKDLDLKRVWDENINTLTSINLDKIDDALKNNAQYKEAFDKVVKAICDAQIKILDSIINDIENDVTRDPGGDEDFLDVMGTVLQNNKKTAASRLGFIPSATFAVTTFLNEKFPNYFEPKI